MKTIIRKTLGLLTMGVVLTGCSKEDNKPIGSDECWYRITIEDEIAYPNLFGQDNIHLSSTYGIIDDEEEGGFSISIMQSKTDGKKQMAFLSGFELEKFNRETAVGTIFTADSSADMFYAHSLITPAWDGTQYTKDYGDGDENVPTLPTIIVKENSDERIRFAISGMLSKFEGGFDNQQPAGLVPIDGEIIIGRSHYISNQVNDVAIAGVNCECKDQ